MTIYIFEDQSEAYGLALWVGNYNRKNQARQLVLEYDPPAPLRGCHLVRIQSDAFTMDPLVPLFFGVIQDLQGDPEKTINFQACLQGRQTQKKYPQADIGPRITKKRFCENMVFAIPRKPRFKSSNCQECTHKSMQKVTWKQAQPKT